MNFEEYVVEKKEINGDSFLLRLKPKNAQPIFEFLPGQFAQVKNPNYEKSFDTHLFSIASSPTTKNYLEFGIKSYGPFTTNLSQLQLGDMLLIRGAFGKFIWDSSVLNAVFVIGGIGITPIMSMLRFIQAKQESPTLTLLYGNRTENSIAYKKDLDQISSTMPGFKIIHILSDVPENKDLPQNRQIGFITKDIIEKEVDLSKKPTFFLCGPPIFIEKMKQILEVLFIEEQRIKQELFSR